MKQKYSLLIILTLVVVVIAGAYLAAPQVADPNLPDATVPAPGEEPSPKMPPQTYRHPSGMFGVSIPTGYYPHELPDGTVIITSKEDITIPQGTEGFAIGEQIVLSYTSFARLAPADTFDAYLEASGFVEGGEVIRELEDIEIDGREGVRALWDVRAADGLMHTHTFPVPGEGVISISVWPYEMANELAEVYGQIIDSLVFSSQ